MMRRALIILLSLATVGTGYLWVESYVRQYHNCSYACHDTKYHLGTKSVGREIEFGSRGELPAGSVLMTKGQVAFFIMYDPDRSVLRLLPVFTPVSWNGFGVSNFGFASSARPAVGVGFPFWSALGLFAVYPSIALVRGAARRYRRRRKGLCISCGYNLTGTTSGKCSECGASI